MTELLPYLMFAALTVFLALGYPVAFTLGGISLAFTAIGLGMDFQLFTLLPLRFWGRMTNFILLSVPLFIFMGVFLEKSGIAEELLDVMADIFGRLRGGVAISIVMVGAVLQPPPALWEPPASPWGSYPFPRCSRGDTNMNWPRGPFALPPPSAKSFPQACRSFWWRM